MYKAVTRYIHFRVSAETTGNSAKGDNKLCMCYVAVFQLLRRCIKVSRSANCIRAGVFKRKKHLLFVQVLPDNSASLSFIDLNLFFDRDFFIL